MENLIVPKNPRSTHHYRRPVMSLVHDDVLPDVRVVDVGTVPMTDEQHTAAVHAIAALISSWRDTRPSQQAPTQEAA